MAIDTPPVATGEQAPAARARLFQEGSPWPRRLEVAAVVVVVGAGVVLRFVARSALWLDEALTVNIAKLPASQIPSWLRHDGHPPLYYLLLHYWMKVFGSSDTAVRALSGVFGLILLPLTWLAGKRFGGRLCAWLCLIVMALSPYAVRYSTETRMYSLLMVLVVAGWLLGQDALRSRSWLRLAGITLLSAALLWSQYWGIWFLAAAGIGLIVHAWRCARAGRPDESRRAVEVIGAIVVGGVLFLPWVPSLLYQAAHTGTPWANPSSPPTAIGDSIGDFGGGSKGAAVIFGWLLVIAALLALFGRALDRRRIELDLRTRPEARQVTWLIVGTLIIGLGFGFLSHSAFATRYDAVWFPFFILLVGLGLTRFTSRPILVGVVVVLSLAGLVASVHVAVTPTRTQARAAAQAIAARAKPGDVVVMCPDQLGPSLNRELPASLGLVQGTYPRFSSPKLVDWVDYVKRLKGVDPAAFANDVLQRAGNHTVFYAWSNAYITHKTSCQDVYNTLQKARPGVTNILADAKGYYEHEAVDEFPSATRPSGGR